MNVWLTALNGCDRVSKKVRTYYCEDHFNLDEDADNFLKLKLMNDTPRLKKDVSGRGENGVEMKRKSQNIFRFSFGKLLSEKMLSNSLSTSTDNILITLKKIRLDYAFKLSGIHFGMTDSNGKIFRKTVIKLAQVLQELIVWPDSNKNKLHLPIYFRTGYGKVVSIIVCLEIEIEKPSNPVHQALTWSQYKHCNTIKYLISCTPDGLVSFISNGFGGRATDVDIVENCVYLEKLTTGMEIMADRRFKNLSSLLAERRCALIRPPSVSSSTPSSPAEVKESKRIAALREILKCYNPILV